MYIHLKKLLIFLLQTQNNNILTQNFNKNTFRWPLQRSACRQYKQQHGLANNKHVAQATAWIVATANNKHLIVVSANDMPRIIVRPNDKGCCFFKFPRSEYYYWNKKIQIYEATNKKMIHCD